MMVVLIEQRFLKLFGIYEITLFSKLDCFILSKSLQKECLNLVQNFITGLPLR
jgi:hypothetical protein